MVRHKSSRPTDRELTILRILWDNGPSTVRHVHEQLTEGHRNEQRRRYRLHNYSETNANND